MNFSSVELTRFVNDCLQKTGVPADEAAIITNTMVEADGRGIHSHGVMRLPLYVERMNNKVVLPAADIQTIQDKDAVAVLEANFSAGQVAGSKAMDLAMEKASRFGIGAVSVRNSNHFGIASHYALKAAGKDMIGIVMSNTTPLMPPTGGAEKVLGNNPLAIAAPMKGGYPLLLDMALSNVALGKILYAKAQGVKIPAGWGADKNGKPSTDPASVLDGGFILPVGGPKGFGLALMVEVLTGVLSGGQFSKQIPSMFDTSRRQSIGHFMLAINIAHFMPPDNFKNLLRQLASYVKEAVKAADVSELYLPGEIEFRTEEKRLETGIPIDGNVVEELNRIAHNMKVARLQPLAE